MRKSLIFMITVFISATITGCVYSHNYDKDGNEMREEEVKEIFSSLIPQDKTSYVKRYPAEYIDADYSHIKLNDADGEDISDIFIDLWYCANAVYNVDDTVMFEMGEEILAESSPGFYELIDYEEIIQNIFSENGIKQLENSEIGSDLAFLQKVEGKTYRLGPWKTGYSYEHTLEDAEIEEITADKISINAKYEANEGGPGRYEDPDYVAKYEIVKVVICKKDDKWLVENYIFPETR